MRAVSRASRKVSSPQLCHVLAEDGDLAEALPRSCRSEATESCLAPSLSVPRGHWIGPHEDLTPDGIGLLVLRGLLIRRVSVEGGSGAELLGRGDVLRPWQGERTDSILPRTSAWRVLEQARFAVLDRTAAARLARYPALTGRLVAKALERSRNLAIAVAIARQRQIDVRLHMLFWHLADRWGRVGVHGVILPLRLTQLMLGDLISAHPASVGTGLTVLSEQGVLHHSGGEWLLSGDPPWELLQFHSTWVGPEARRSTSGPHCATATGEGEPGPLGGRFS